MQEIHGKPHEGVFLFNVEAVRCNHVLISNGRRNRNFSHLLCIAKRALEPGYFEEETGVTRLPNGTYYVMSSSLCMS